MIRRRVSQVVLKQTVKTVAFPVEVFLETDHRFETFVVIRTCLIEPVSKLINDID